MDVFAVAVLEHTMFRESHGVHGRCEASAVTVHLRLLARHWRQAFAALMVRQRA